MDEIIDELYYEAEDNLSMLDTIIAICEEEEDDNNELLERLQNVLDKTDNLFLML